MVVQVPPPPAMTAGTVFRRASQATRSHTRVAVVVLQLVRVARVVAAMVALAALVEPPTQAVVAAVQAASVVLAATVVPVL